MILRAPATRRSPDCGPPGQDAGNAPCAGQAALMSGSGHSAADAASPAALLTHRQRRSATGYPTETTRVLRTAGRRHGTLSSAKTCPRNARRFARGGHKARQKLVSDISARHRAALQTLRRRSARPARSRLGRDAGKLDAARPGPARRPTGGIADDPRAAPSLTARHDAIVAAAWFKHWATRNGGDAPSSGRVTSPRWLFASLCHLRRRR